MRKEKNKHVKHKNENISTGESLPGVPEVFRNQKLSTEYDFDSFEVKSNSSGQLFKLYRGIVGFSNVLF